MENLSLIELAQSIQEKKYSCFEVASFYVNRIKKYNDNVNAVITLNEDILDQAKERDVQGLKGLPLEGIPILFKDMFCTEGIKTTAGSKILQNFIPHYSATVVQRFVDAGALILGKCNQDEFAMGCTNETSFFGACKNPWNLDHVSGGSSGGSAAAVSCEFSPIALGTDTGGSVRQPSHYCNLFGIKPTYGRVSRYGIISYASSFDQAGVMSQKVQDSAFALNIISGKDSKDATSSSKSVPLWQSYLSKDIKGLKIGFLDHLDGFSSSILKSYDLAKETLKKGGAQLKPIEFTFLEYAISVYYLISASEASSNLARYDGIKYGFSTSQSSSNLKDFYCQTRGEGFGKEVKKRILMGTFCLSQGYFEAYFEKAQRVRHLIKNEFEKLFQEVDVLITPVTKNLPPKIGSRVEGDLKYYTGDIFTVFSNLTGIPSASVPISIIDGFPTGLQIMAPAFDEQTLFNISYFLQEELESYKEKPQAYKTQ